LLRVTDSSVQDGGNRDFREASAEQNRRGGGGGALPHGWGLFCPTAAIASELRTCRRAMPVSLAGSQVSEPVRDESLHLHGGEYS